MNQILLSQADQEWENFVNRLSDDEKGRLQEFAEPVASIKLHYYAATKDFTKFNQTVNQLSKRYLYDEEVVPTVYNFYVEKGFHELAFEYITNAIAYLQESGKNVSPAIQSIADSSVSKHLLMSLQKSLVNIRSIKPKDLALITPDIVNDKRGLNEFVLCEIVQASKILLDKVHAVKKNPHENRYNDLLLAILRLRFQIWNWSIHDQARTGSSASGKDAGETDITIQAGNVTIALFEALILKGNSRKNVHKHIVKCFTYVSYLERYYMVIYFKGDASNFDATWDSYKSDTSTCNFPSGFVFDNVKGFEDLSMKFEDVGHLKIARSFHGNGVEMFHIMIDLSQ